MRNHNIETVSLTLRDPEGNEVIGIEESSRQAAKYELVKFIVDTNLASLEIVQEEDYTVKIEEQTAEIVGASQLLGV